MDEIKGGFEFLGKFSRVKWNLKIQQFFFIFFIVLRNGIYWIHHLYNVIRLKMAGVCIGMNFSTAGVMILDVCPGSEVTIGKNVIIVSDSRRSNASSLAFPAKIKTLSASSKIIIGDNVGLNGTSITSRSKTICIGAGTIIAPNVIIVDSDFHKPWPPDSRMDYPGDELDGDIQIGNNCWIGMNTIILKGVKIGENSIIGAGSVIVKNIPPNSLAGGVPAKVVKVYK